MRSCSAAPTFATTEMEVKSLDALNAGVFYHAVPDFPERGDRNAGLCFYIFDVAAAQSVDDVLVN